MDTRGIQENGGQDTSTLSCLSITACLRCREQKVTACSFRCDIAPFAESELAPSSSVVVNVPRALDASDSARHVAIPALQIAEVHEVNADPDNYIGQPNAVENTFALDALLFSVFPTN